MVRPKEQFQLLRSLLRHFGLGGALLFLRFNLGSLNAFRVPGIAHKITLRRGTSDLIVFKEIFLNREYDVPFSTAPKVIIDGGANIGLFAVLMKNRYPDSKVICIEPDPENFRLLKENLSNYSDVHFENTGLWNVDTKLKVYDKFANGKWGMIVEEDMESGNIAAMSVTSLLKKYDIEEVDVFKCDIETSEKQVFARDYDDWLPRMKWIIIELHDRIEPGCAKAFFNAINKCFKGYKFEISGENVVIENDNYR